MSEKISDEVLKEGLEYFKNKPKPLGMAIIQSISVFTELLELRAEIATLREPKSNEAVALHVELKRVREEIETLRESRHCASSLLDCVAENKRMREALEYIAQSSEIEAHWSEEIAKNALEGK